MKNLSKLILMSLTFLSIAIISCKKEDPDPCENVTCLNGGTCNNGSCSCATGYEGATCGTEMRSKFIGTYTAAESCTPGGNFNYTLTITTSGTGVSNIILNNFYGVGVIATGTINGSSLTIPNQIINIPELGAVTASGSGQISGNILTMSYTLVGGTDSDACTATCTKQ